MLTGLEILLARMQTNPEEFLKDDGLMPFQGETFGGKWSDLLDYAWRVGDDEERKMLQDAKIEFHRDDFNERVFKRLAGEEVKQEINPYKAAQQKQMAQQQMLQQHQMMAAQGSHYDSNTQGYATITGGFQAVETKQESMPINKGGTGFTGFLGLGKLFWGRK